MRSGIVTKDPVDIFLPHGAGLVIAETGHRGRDERQTGHGPGGLPAGMAQLHGDVGPRRVDGFHQAPEAGQQAIVIDTELMREALAVGTDVGGFRDQETGTAFGPFLVVGHQPVGHFAPGGTCAGTHGRGRRPAPAGRPGRPAAPPPPWGSSSNRASSGTGRGCLPGRGG